MMPGGWADTVLKPETIGLGLLVLVILGCGAAGIRLYLRKRPTAEELERRRREMLNRLGKIGDGEIIEFEGASIVYSYQVSGVSYMATQDLTTLGSYVPSGQTAVIGPVSLKFDRRNPANSIVVCEQWSGMRYMEPARRGPDRVA